MFIDKKGRLFGKISIIDVLIVLIVLGGILGLLFQFEIIFSGPEETDRIETIFYTEQVGDFVKDSIKVGDEVRAKVNNTLFGKVTRVETDESAAYEYNSEGQGVKSSKEGYISIKVYVEGTGNFNDNGVSFGGTALNAGGMAEIRFGGRTVLWTRFSGFKKIEE